MPSIEVADFNKDGSKKPRSKCRHWRLYAYTGRKKNGRYEKRSKYFDGTETEARAEAQRFEDELRSKRSSEMYFSDWALAWIRAREQDPDIRPSTVQRDWSSVNTLKALMAEYRLCDIDVAACEEFIYQLKTEGSPSGKKDLKSSYISSLETHLSQILQDAVRAGLMSSNPMRAVRKRTHKGVMNHENVPSVDEIENMVSRLTPFDRYHIALYLAARTGMRRGEILGLRWGDVSFKKKVISVRQSMSTTGELGPLKTESSRRSIVLTDSMVEALKIRKKYQEDMFRSMKASKNLPKMPDMKDVLVVADRFNRPMSCASLTSFWAHHKEKDFGMTCTLHELRHGFLSMLASLNVHPSVMQAIAGHKTPVITLEIYTHTNSDAMAAAMEKTERALLVEVESPEE